MCKAPGGSRRGDTPYAPQLKARRRYYLHSKACFHERVYLSVGRHLSICFCTRPIPQASPFPQCTRYSPNHVDCCHLAVRSVQMIQCKKSHGQLVRRAKRTCLLRESKPLAPKQFRGFERETYLYPDKCQSAFQTSLP